MGIKGRKKEKQIQIIGGLFGILVAAASLFYFFHAEKAQAEKRMVDMVNYVKVQCSTYTHFNESSESKSLLRATMLNLMVGLNGYTLCSGIICESLNGDDYCAVKLKSDELMTIGYIKRKGVAISPLGEKYLEEIKKYKAMGDDSGYRDIL